MKNLPKFLIAHNIQANPDGLYVVHTQKPRFIGVTIPKNGEIEPIDNIMLQHKFDAGTRTNRLPSGEYYIMGVSMWIDKPDMQQIPKLMSRTGDWLFAYFKSLPK